MKKVLSFLSRRKQSSKKSDDEIRPIVKRICRADYGSFTDLKIRNIVYSCSDKELDFIVHNTDKWWVLKHVPACCNKHLLNLLVRNDNSLVRMAVAARRDKDTLEVLSHDNDPFIRRYVAIQTRSFDALLTNDPSADVRTEVCKRTDDEDIIQSFTKDTNRKVRYQILTSMYHSHNLKVRTSLILRYDRDEEISNMAKGLLADTFF